MIKIRGDFIQEEVADRSQAELEPDSCIKNSKLENIN